MTFEEKQAQFHRWVDLYHDALFRYALRSLGDRLAAQDVVQTTYVKAWSLLEKSAEPVDDPFPWLVKILRYRLLESFRASRRDGGPDLESVAEPSADGENPDGVMARKELSRVLAECFGKLTLIDQQIIQLRLEVIEVPEIPASSRRPTLEEIARAMTDEGRNYTRDGVRMRANRALGMLRGCLRARLPGGSLAEI